jgi:hypothetical protein
LKLGFISKTHKSRFDYAHIKTPFLTKTCLLTQCAWNKIINNDDRL